MRRRFGRLRSRDMTLLVGWLFADLLLGLMMIFLISAPGAASKALICLLTPAPSAKPATPSPASTTSSAAGPQMVQLRFSGHNGVWQVSQSFVAGVPFAQPAKALAPAITCPTPTPTSTQTPVPTPNRNAISKTAVDFDFQSNAHLLLQGDTGEKNRLMGLINQKFGAKFQSDDQAGFVLTFGTSGDPTEGENLATAFNNILENTLPHFFARATLRAFHDIGPNRGDISLEVYLFVVSG